MRPMRPSLLVCLEPPQDMPAPFRMEHPHPEGPVVARKGEFVPSMFAVALLGGKQHKVTPGDLFMVTRQQGVDIGEEITLKKIMLVGTRDLSVMGKPYVPGASMVVSVQEHTLTKQIVVFKMKRRKGYRRTKGYRSEVTIVKVESIRYDDGNSVLECIRPAQKDPEPIEAMSDEQLGIEEEADEEEFEEDEQSEHEEDEQQEEVPSKER